MKINLQNVTNAKNVPSLPQFKKWVSAALAYNEESAATELTIRLVNNKESTELNFRYRHKKGPTNILSFPTTTPEELAENYLGDLVICIPLVKKEAREQNKTFIAHLAHLVIHGTLHCLGYTHDKKQDTSTMEKAEIIIMQQLGYANPYL